MFAGLRMLFVDSQIIRTTNYVTYGIQNFTSDVGGLAGLFLGFSLLSLFELTIKLFLLITRMINKNKVDTKDKNKSKGSQICRVNDVVIEIPNFKALKKHEEKIQNVKFKSDKNVCMISPAMDKADHEENRNPFEILEL